MHGLGANVNAKITDKHDGIAGSQTAIMIAAADETGVQRPWSRTTSLELMSLPAPPKAGHP